MVRRLGAFSVLSIVVLAAVSAAPAAAEHRITIEGAKNSVRTTLRSEFEGGVKKGSLRLDCARDGDAVRCGVDLRDDRNRAWCGYARVRPGHGTANGVPVRSITRFRLRRFGCES